LQLSGLGSNSQVSRLHCQLDINPPFASVSDLASTNGTYVNGQSIPPNVHPDDTLGDPPWSRDLKDGDEIRVGEVLLRVRILHEECETVVDSSAEFECDFEALEPAPVL
jgi:pSer/pThr/pTyr-binding forkhead associated (FHA) protein